MSTIEDTDLEEQARRLLIARQPRRRDEPRLAPALAMAVRHDVETPHGHVAAWRIGEGPAVMLVHGWDDDNSLWTRALEVFSKAERAVVVLDLPGHGHTQADDAHWRVAAAAISAVAQRLAPVVALITHSYGGAVSVAAMQAGLDVKRIVLLAATIPRRMKGFDPDMLPARERAVHERASAIYEARTGSSMSLFDIEAAARQMDAKALFVHSADDEYPAANAEHLATLWPAAAFELVDGLGHRRIARDETVICRALRFLEDEA